MNAYSGITAFILGFAGCLFFMQLLAAANHHDGGMVFADPESRPDPIVYH